MVTGCVSISAFASLVGIPVGIVSSAIKICAITVEIKKCKAIIKKSKEKHGKKVLIAKTKLSVEVLISKTLIDSYVSHDEFISVNNVLNESGNIKKKKSNILINKYVWCNAKI